MTATVTASDMPESFNGHHAPTSGNSISLATRHLCAVTHMRRFMLTEESFESDPPETPPRRWVGRAYALSVLADQQRTGPMPGVDIGTVKRECWSAIRQTLIRDAAGIAVIAAAATFDPRGTVMVIGLIVAIVALAGRIKISLPLVLAAAILLALIVGSPSGRAPFAAPLSAFGICYLIYAADSFLASRRVRRVMTRTLAAQTDSNGRLPADGPHDISGDHSRRPVLVFYDKLGILGAGTPLTPITSTVPVDKPQEGKLIDPFDASDLLEHIFAHVRSQGAINNAADGFAHRRIWLNGEWRTLNIPPPRVNGSSPLRRPMRDDGNEAFTYGLPELDVDEVIAIPGPTVKERPLWWMVARRLLRLTGPAQLSHGADAHQRAALSNSPSVFPERRYVRACTTTWHGELVVSVYVGATLQAHYLRLIIRPYILAPMVPQLRQIEDIAERNAIVHLVAAISGTAKGFFKAAAAVNKLKIRRGRTTARAAKRSALLSTRERYAMSDTDSVHHQEDARRIFQILEMKVFKVTETYLEAHNIDVEEYKKQVQVLIEKSMIITGGQNSGNFDVTNYDDRQRRPGGGGRGGGDGDGPSQQ